MKIVIESDGSYISLKAHKENFTLYWSDLQPYVDCETAEDMCQEIESYLLDVLPDEGHPDWTWNRSDLKKACHKVFKYIRK